MLSFLLPPPNDSPPFIQGTEWRVLLDDVCVWKAKSDYTRNGCCIHLGLKQKGSAGPEWWFMTYTLTQLSQGHMPSLIHDCSFAASSLCVIARGWLGG